MANVEAGVTSGGFTADTAGHALGMELLLIVLIVLLVLGVIGVPVIRRRPRRRL